MHDVAKYSKSTLLTTTTIPKLHALTENLHFKTILLSVFIVVLNFIITTLLPLDGFAPEFEEFMILRFMVLGSSGVRSKNGIYPFCW